MLTVAQLGSGGASYYLNLASTNSGYYVNDKGLEPSGTWSGFGAKEFGLSGIVGAEELAKLCEGFDPHDGKRLVRNAGSEKRVHGFDLTWSAPKSVSVVWALASPELRKAIEQAMHRAVQDGLSYIQDTCGIARVGAQGQKVVKAPLLFANFEHSSSRAGDVQLHVHTVVPNVCVLGRKPNGKLHTVAIDPTPFFDHQHAGGAVFRASLSASLKNLGFEIERDKTCFQIKGVSKSMCDRVSQRRAEIVDGILEKCRKLGMLLGFSKEEILKHTRGRMAELVTLETRRAKQELSRDDVFEATRKVALEFGIGEGHIETLLHQAEKVTPHQKEKIKEGIWRKTIDQITDQHSHWNERELTKRLAIEAQGTGLNASDVRELIAHKLSSGNDLVRVGVLLTDKRSESHRVWRDRTEERFTTREMLALESSLLLDVARMAREGGGIPAKHVKAAILTMHKNLAEKHKKLTPEQAQAVAKITTGKGRIACLVGHAGTSKSTILGGCRDAWERAGKAVLGCAVAGVAADSLKKSSGIESDTLAMMLLRLEKGWLTLSPNHVVVLDEAGMLGTKQTAKLLNYVARSGASLVLSGEQEQLQPIEAGGPFGSIVERISNVARLTEIFRQRETWRKETVVQLSRGEALAALTAYALHRQLHVTESREDSFAKTIELWKANGCHRKENCREGFILASLNSEVTALNRLAQAERLKAGELSDECLQISGDKIHVGDRVLLTKRDRKILKVENGFYGEVIALDTEARKFTIRLDGDGREVQASVAGYGNHVRLGYCSTVHKSQGSTRESVFVLVGNQFDKHLSYVAASRSTGVTHLVCDQADVRKEPTIANALRSLAKAMSKDRMKELATDLLERNQRERIPVPLRQIREAPSLGQSI